VKLDAAPADTDQARLALPRANLLIADDAGLAKTTAMLGSFCKTCR
jgi:hypothetical protein